MVHSIEATKPKRCSKTTRDSVILAIHASCYPRINSPLSYRSTMKSIQEEILEVYRTSHQTKNKVRDANAALTYYGFYEEVLPELALVGKKYSIGSCQSVSETLKKYFKSNSAIKQIYGIQTAAELVTSKPVSFWSIAQSELCKAGSISKDYAAADLQRLLKDLGLCEEFELHTPTGEKVTRANAAEFEEFLFVHREVKKSVLDEIGQLKKISSHRGIAKLDSIEFLHFIGEDRQRLVKGIPGSWQCLHENQTWFLFKDSSGTRLLKQMKKAFCTGSKIEINRLAESIKNGLQYRSAELIFPPVEVIEKYLRSSKFTSVHDELVTFHGERGELTDIEAACVQYFKSIGHKTVNAATLRSHLKSQGFQKKENIDDVIYKKAIVHIDKSDAEGNYQFSLVCKRDGDLEVDKAVGRYPDFVNRLKEPKMSREGKWHVETDSESEYNIPDWITRNDVLESMREFELLDGFAQSTFYDVLDDNGVRYPPKAVIGLASRRYTDVSLRGRNFQGGPGTKCFRILEKFEFRIVPKAVDGNRDFNETQTDVDSIKRNPNLDQPTKRRLIEARTGQGQFRKDILSIEKRCRVTGVSNPDLLIAGHIVPFSNCLTNEEKYDPNNGLLFTPNADRLFERGLVSFGDDGALILSNQLADKDRDALGIPAKLNVGSFNSEQLSYLRRHRELHSI